MARKLLAFVLTLLLLGLQQELLLHPLTHLGNLQQRSEAGIQLPATDVACVECALLAGASSAATNAGATPSCIVPATECVAFGTQARLTAAPRYYQSRAPPLVL